MKKKVPATPEKKETPTKKLAPVSEQKTAEKKAPDAPVAGFVGKDKRTSYVGKTYLHTKKNVKVEVLSIMKDAAGTGLNVKYPDGSKGTASVNLLK